MKTLRNLILTLTVCAFMGSAVAQQELPSAAAQTAPRSQVVRLNKAPVSNDILKVNLPKPTKTVLPNGLKVLILEDHRFPLISTSMLLEGAGGLYDPKDRPGLALVTSQMLRQGTKTRTSKQLAQEIDTLGANINASAGTGNPNGVFQASGLSDNFDKWFPIAVDVLLHPSFPQDELNIVKQRALMSLRQQMANPGFLGQQRMMKALYGDHPASVVSPTPEAINAMTTAELEKFYTEHYVPQNAILAIAGDVNPTELIAKLKTYFADWKKTDFKATIPANPAPATAAKIFLVDRPGSVQTNLLLGNLAIDRRNPDYVPLSVLNHILGGGAGGRLFMNLREEKSYTYGAYSRFDAGEMISPWVANSEVRTTVTAGAMTEFYKEIKRLSDEPVPADELARAKRAITARFALSLERPASLLAYAIVAERFGFGDDYWDKYPAMVNAVTPADLERVARKYFALGAVQVVAVGDAKTIKAELDKFGSVVVYKADGTPVSAPAATPAGN